MNLKHRSYKKELLDSDNIPENDLRQNLAEIKFVNKWLGGHNITIAGLMQVAAGKKEITVCEIGCGGGDNISVLERWCSRININANFIGIDIKPECIAFAKQNYPHKNVEWIISDYEDVHFLVKPDIIFSSLFCHHFSDEQLIAQLLWMKQNSTDGFFINDLQRNWFAYYSIKWLTRLFSKSYLVKHDAPLSVARGLTKKEWQSIFTSAGLHNYKLVWKWAFRHLLIYKHERPYSI